MANTHSLDLESSSSQYGETSAFANTITGDFTIEAWLKPESLSALMTIVSKWKASTNSRSYMMELNTSGDIVMHTSNNGGTDSTSSFATGLATGTYAHIAAVFTTATHKMEVFKNGVSVSSNTASYNSGIDNGTCELAVGTVSNVHGAYFDGLIDDVRIWNTTKTGADILASYQSELAGNESNLVEYWKLNNSALTSMLSGGHDLTLSGSPVYSTTVPFTGIPTVKHMALLGVG